ncbi:MAG: PKD domain-containing protein, partial [Bacteroidia bacterium]|nr:PKD domain-containing protein [Bacteroidia bacterium]
MNQLTKSKLVKRIFLALLIIGCLVEKSFSINDALKVKISNTTYSDETVVRFLDGATDNFDFDYDAWKLFSSNPNIPAIFTKTDSVSDLSINAFPNLTGKKEVELFLKIVTAGIYTIQAYEIGLFTEGTSIMLEDKYTGNVYFFKDNASITLNISATSVLSPSRFVLHFSPPTVLFSTNVSCNAFQNGTINVQKPGNVNFDTYLKNSVGDTLQVAFYINELIEFTNLSIGNYIVETYSAYSAPDTNYITITQPPTIVADFTFNFINATTLEFVNNSVNAENYVWQFGDGSTDSINIHPTYQYNSNGIYQVTLIAMDSICSSTIVQEVEVFQMVTSIGDTNENEFEKFSVFQQNNVLSVNYSGELQKPITLTIYNSIGQLIYQEKMNSVEFSKSIVPVSTGCYIVLLDQPNKQL